MNKMLGVRFPKYDLFFLEDETEWVWDEQFTNLKAARKAAAGFKERGETAVVCKREFVALYAPKKTYQE